MISYFTFGEEFQDLADKSTFFLQTIKNLNNLPEYL